MKNKREKKSNITYHFTIKNVAVYSTTSKIQHFYMLWFIQNLPLEYKQKFYPAIIFDLTPIDWESNNFMTCGSLIGKLKAIMDNLKNIEDRIVSEVLLNTLYEQQFISNADGKKE